MSIPITRGTLVAAYELLRTCPPFIGWKLPDVSDVKFAVIRGKHVYGDCDGETLRVSSGKHGQLQTLLMTVAHEAIHLHQFRAGLNAPNTEHNADFWRRAKRVCAIHGWDLRGF